jgi:hypothetical protein
VRAVEALLAPGRVSSLLGVGELLPGIAVIASRSPVAVASLARAGGAVATGAPRSALALLLFLLGARLLGGVPQSAARKPFQYRIGVLLAKPLEGWQDLVAVRGAERCRQPSGDDGPVRKAWGHISPLRAA